MAEETTVAVIGAGLMGATMARNLLEAGIRVRVWNHSREKAEPLTQDLRMKIAGAVVARFDEAIEAGQGEEDMAAVYEAARPERG